VIDCAADADFLLTRGRLEAWEAAHGRIEAGSWVLLRSDWSKRLDPAAFLNAAADGPHTPGPDPDCVRFMVRERDVIGFGTETVGTDAG
jgi:kynurenine formamidase